MYTAATGNVGVTIEDISDKTDGNGDMDDGESGSGDTDPGEAVDIDDEGKILIV